MSEVRGQCPVCGRIRDVKKDGTMRYHLGDWSVGGYLQMCRGVGQPPAETWGQRDG